MVKMDNSTTSNDNKKQEIQLKSAIDNSQKENKSLFNTKVQNMPNPVRGLPFTLHPVRR